MRCGNREDCRHLRSLNDTHEGLSTCKCIFVAFSVDHPCSGIDEPARVVAVPAAVEGSSFSRHFNIHKRLQPVRLLACVPRAGFFFFGNATRRFQVFLVGIVSTLYASSTTATTTKTTRTTTVRTTTTTLTAMTALPSCSTIRFHIQKQRR